MYISKYFAGFIVVASVLAITACGGADKSATDARPAENETFEVRLADQVISLSRQDLVNRLATDEISESTPIKAGNEWVPLRDHESAQGALAEADLLQFNLQYADRIADQTVAKVNPLAPGRRMDIRPFIVPGRVTIFDFYSEYCEACTVMEPRLVALAEARPDIFLRSVDVNRPGVRGIDFVSPLARQYGIQALPHFMIFNERGEYMASGYEADLLIMTWIRELQG